MTDQTLPPGKDASLEYTIDRAFALLKPMNLEVEAISWIQPAPDCWSVHLQSTASRHLYTNGKGTCKQAALASALGEFFERLSTNFFFSDWYLDEGKEEPPFLFFPEERWFPWGRGSTLPKKAPDDTKLLTASLCKFYNPHGELAFEHLCDNNTDSLRRGICTLPFTDMGSGKSVYFPVSLLNNLYVSNGMAAGNSPAECSAQALSEIIERYVKNIIISRGLSLPDIPASHLSRYPRLRRIIKRLTAEGLEVRVKDGSLGGMYPVICALLTDTVNGGVYASFGANLRFETAIERTLTELLQGRTLEGLKHFQPPCHEFSLVADPFNLESHFVDSDGLLAWTMFQNKVDYSFSPWDFSGSSSKELTDLLLLFKKLGARLYRAEYTHCGMYACRIIAPGFSEIYPLDDLLYNNRSAGSVLRSDLLQLPCLDKRQLSAFLNRLEELGLNDHELLSQIIGIVFDEDSAWATLRVGELKALLLLAMQKHQEALHWCLWSLDHADLPALRQRMYRLLHTLLAFKLADQKTSDYSDTLSLLYTKEELKAGEDIVYGRSKFPGLVFASSWSEIAREHNKLLRIYGRINQIKEAGVKTGR